MSRVAAAQSTLHDVHGGCTAIHNLADTFQHINELHAAILLMLQAH